MNKLFIPLLALTFAFPPLLNANLLTDGTPQEIMRHIDRLVDSGEKPSSQTINQLKKYIEDDSAAVLLRERSAWALGQMNIRKEVDTLVKAAKSKSLLIRSAAVDGLLHMRARSGFDVYVDISKTDPVLSMREKATVALGLLRWEKAINPIVELSDDPRLEVRGAAVLGMGATHSGQNDFREVLQDMTKDPEPFVSSRAEIALDMANRREAALKPLLTHEDPNIRLFVAQFFHYHGQANDLDSIQAALQKEKNSEVAYEMKLASQGIKKREEKRKEEERKRQEEERKRREQAAAEKAASQPASAN